MTCALFFATGRLHPLFLQSLAHSFPCNGGWGWPTVTNQPVYNENEHHRQSIRLLGADYSEPGGCFLTICAAGRKQIFGRIDSDRTVLSPLGEIVRQCRIQIPAHFQQASLAEFVVMPNHMHGIIALHSKIRNGEARVGARYIVPSSVEAHTPERFQKPVRDSIPTIVRTFKAAVTRAAKKSLGWEGEIWQRNYFERVLRGGKEYATASRYILENPMRWKWDRENAKREVASNDETTSQWLR